MKLSIFSRLVFGYLAIFILAMAVSIYAIAQLRQLENISRSILNVDNQLLTYEQKLSNGLLSMMRYEKKYVIMKDDGLYDNFLSAKNDFENNVTETISVADTVEAVELLSAVRNSYEQYHLLFDEEVRYLKAGQNYPADEYDRKKEVAVKAMMNSLRDLRAYSQNSTYDKIKQLKEAEGNASKVAIITGIIALLTGAVISVFITINITKPLGIIKKKTKEISRGEFGKDLKLTSPPEISELANAFNIMCRKLKEIDKLKSDFFSLMSHELRTPLTTIKEGTNLMLEDLNGDRGTGKQMRLLTIINEESNRLINLVNSLLDLSKMEGGMMAFNFTRNDIMKLISQVTREIEPLAETRRIVIQTSMDEGLPLIKLDRDRILQVLRNLIGNAVKFTNEGGRVSVHSHMNEQGIHVSVEDSGVGIAHENLSTIFDKYQQVTLAGSNKIKGTGLGLSIVKHIINAHGGKIWVESTPGKGSIFSFILPA